MSHTDVFVSNIPEHRHLKTVLLYREAEGRDAQIKT